MRVRVERSDEDVKKVLWSADCVMIVWMKKRDSLALDTYYILRDSVRLGRVAGSSSCAQPHVLSMIAEKLVGQTVQSDGLICNTLVAQARRNSWRDTKISACIQAR